MSMVGPQLLSIRKGSDDDIHILSDLSKELYLEQNPKGSVELDQIKKTILNKIHSDSQVFLFEVNKMIIGYSLVSLTNDPLNIEEFFIIPGERGNYYGNAAVVLLSEATNWKSVKVDAPVWREMAGGM
jgi:hypothetical protein